MTDPRIERYFAVLGLQPQASEQEVKEARNFVTQAFHPDKFPPGSKDQERANLKQIEINEAYQKIIEHFDRVKRDQALIQAPISAGGGPGPGDLASGAGRSKTPMVVMLVKVLLVLALAGAWAWTVSGWAGSMRTPAAQSSGSQTPTPTNPALSSATQARSVPPGTASLPDVPTLDLLLLLSLVLSTLAVVWFLFAPESRVLIDRLLGTQK